MATRHQTDLRVCGKLPGINVGKVSEQYDGICVARGCDSFVRQAIKAYVCDECSYGSKGERCVISGMPAVAEAYYCEECVQLGKDRDGCPCVLNVGVTQRDGYFERKKNTGGGE